MQRLAANLTGPGPQGPGLGRHITPARPRRGLDGAGGGTPPRVGRGAARRPLGAGGTAQRAGREPPPPPAGGGPFPLPAAAASDGGRVWGVTQQQTAAPPLSAAAQGPAWGPLRCGTAADAHGVPGPQSGPRPPFGAGYANKGRPVSGGWVWCWPPPPLDKVPFICHFPHRGETIKGRCPFTPQRPYMLWF